MIDLPDLLAALAQERPLFHSEADFQHALAWHLHLLEPTARVRLEYRPLPARSIYLDLWVETPTQILAIELKYLTRRLTVPVAGETYALRDHGAQDQRRYDFVKDLARLEDVLSASPAVTAYAVLLTNDSAYWRPVSPTTAADTAFRVHEGATLQGNLAWAAHVGAGTAAGREATHFLHGCYTLHWADYSQVEEGMKYGRFRYLAVPIALPGSPVVPI